MDLSNSVARCPHSVASRSVNGCDVIVREVLSYLTEGNKVLIRLKGVNFASNKTAINPQSKVVLDKVEAALDEFQGSKVTVEGHTDTIGTKKANMETTTQLSIKLTAVYGLCIPIIIRTNEGKVSSTLSDLELVSPQASSQYLKFNINRSGDISTYGDIVIEFTPLQGKSVQIALVRGIGVYPEINKRKMVVKLNTIPGIPLSKGKMKVSYITNDESKKPVLYTNSELDI